VNRESESYIADVSARLRGLRQDKLEVVGSGIDDYRYHVGYIRAISDCLEILLDVRAKYNRD
jgi:hypothetical protein